jgi:hypothetical protein
MVLKWGIGPACYLSSQTSSIRPPLKMLLTMIVSPFYELIETFPGDGYAAHVLEMTSQRWRDETEVDRPLWLAPRLADC